MAFLSGRRDVLPPTISHPRSMRLFLGLAVALSLLHPVLSTASTTTPPTGENAYCGKGDVAKFGENDGPA
ncbi:MAG: hypothetical protein ABSD39_00005, partial [Terriglobales bacterium]